VIERKNRTEVWKQRTFQYNTSQYILIILMVITARNDDYSQWYLDVAKSGQLFEYSPTPGCITFLPKSVTMWSRIQQTMQKKLDRLGVQNVYLPMLVPMSFFEREKDHVEGFAPELAVVTIGWGKELEEPLAIRPTSELLFCDFFKDKLQSYRDLPMLYNQWVSVLRWEKRTRPFLRTAEFYWQEGHTLHENRTDADTFALNILNNVYIETINEIMAIEGIRGRKSTSEKFAGADTTYTYEPMMSNGWALQICTSHLLWQGFMEGFWVKYQDRDGSLTHPWYTSWGLSTRSIGGIISSHSDDKGLIIPPKMSEFIACILPLYTKDNREVIGEYARNIAKILLGENTNEVPVQWEYFRALVNENGKVQLDLRDARLGEKITDWEIAGYPIRIECGERDREAGKCVVVSRITGEKLVVELGQVHETVQNMLNEGQSILRERSKERLVQNTVVCTTLEELGDAMENGKFALWEWDQNPEFEKEIKEKFKATTRCIPFEGQFTDVLMPNIQEWHVRVIIARSF
jgi:prolyl-tRNA synthetase